MRRAASVVSEIFAPWVINIGFFLVLGAVTKNWVPATASAIGTGVVPMVLILVLMRSKDVGGHHVTSKRQRGPVLVGIVVCVLALIGVLCVLATDPLVWTGVLMALAFVVLFTVMTAVGKIKASIHVGLWLCVTVFLAGEVSPLWLFSVVAVPVIGWSRVALNHHTVGEVSVGALLGLMVSCVTLMAF